jgi:hypothetical protein
MRALPSVLGKRNPRQRASTWPWAVPDTCGAAHFGKPGKLLSLCAHFCLLRRFLRSFRPERLSLCSGRVSAKTSGGGVEWNLTAPPPAQRDLPRWPIHSRGCGRQAVAVIFGALVGTKGFRQTSLRLALPGSGSKSARITQGAMCRDAVKHGDPPCAPLVRPCCHIWGDLARVHPSTTQKRRKKHHALLSDRKVADFRNERGPGTPARPDWSQTSATESARSSAPIYLRGIVGRSVHYDDFRAESTVSRMKSCWLWQMITMLKRCCFTASP